MAATNVNIDLYNEIETALENDSKKQQKAAKQVQQCYNKRLVILHQPAC